jgi:hypothetical protein
MHYPEFGLLLGAEGDTDTEDIAIVTAMWKRFARNLKSHVVFCSTANRPVQEVVNELAAIA